MKKSIMIVKQSFRVKIPLMCDPAISEKRQPMNTLLLGIMRQRGRAFQTATSDARAHVSQIHTEGNKQSTPAGALFCLR